MRKLIYNVLETGQEASIKKRANTIYLIEDQWDDWFEYNTMYDLWIVDENLNKKYIGKIKIGQFNMEGKVRANIPKKFEYLSSEFFSLGQDSYYYENIKTLNSSVRENIFKNLNDIAFDKNLFKKSYAENVTKKSLLRGIEKETVEKQFHRIATGGPRLVPYKFVYESYVEAKEETSIKMTFEIDPESFPPSNIHVLIGRNGVGKTRLITQMINTILKNNRKSSNTFGTVFFAEDEDRYNESFSKVIFTSFSAFDENKIITRSTKYSRIGLPSNRRGKNELDETIINSEDLRTLKLTNEFIQGFKECIFLKHEDLLKRALMTLSSDPIFDEAKFVEYCDKNNFDEDRLKELFRRLSSGHKIIIFAITQLLSKVQEKSLVFLDEPEGHLHPPLLSAFIRALSDLLSELNGAAIIATHSPIILQEVPKDCVWKLIRHGKISRAERPQIETFGQDIISLTSDVFGLEVDRSGFHKLLEELVKQHNDYHSVMKVLNYQLGTEGRALLKTMFLLKKEETTDNAQT